jgi:hypothetical protein
LNELKYGRQKLEVDDQQILIYRGSIEGQIRKFDSNSHFLAISSMLKPKILFGGNIKPE